MSVVVPSHKPGEYPLSNVGLQLNLIQIPQESMQILLYNPEL